jgi:hypothetical protein
MSVVGPSGVDIDRDSAKNDAGSAGGEPVIGWVFARRRTPIKSIAFDAIPSDKNPVAIPLRPEDGNVGGEDVAEAGEDASRLRLPGASERRLSSVERTFLNSLFLGTGDCLNAALLGLTLAFSSSWSGGWSCWGVSGLQLTTSTLAEGDLSFCSPLHEISRVRPI